MFPPPLEFSTFAKTLRSAPPEKHIRQRTLSRENILENVILGEAVAALIAQTLCDI